MNVEADAPADVAAGLTDKFPGAIEVVKGETHRSIRRCLLAITTTTPGKWWLQLSMEERPD
jgi:hypothetical protein